MPPPPPHTPRTLFELFATYDERQGLDSVLAASDLADLAPRDIYACALGRRPESLKAATRPPAYNPRNHLHATLNSPEFQGKAMLLLLNAYPEKRRLLFVHVPKCAGTDLRVSLTDRYPSLDVGLGDPEWTKPERLFAAIRNMVVAVRSADTILIHGHVRLLSAVEQELVRPYDQVITVIRDPQEIVVSNINYVITRILQDQKLGAFAPDTVRWLRQLGVERLPPDMPAAAAMQTCKALLRNRAVTPRNSICHWLGNGDLRSFLNRVVINDVEITDTSHYSAWLQQRWGIQRIARANQSMQFVTRAMLDADDLDHVASVTEEDRKVYAMISEQIERRGRTSIHGREITGIEAFL